MSEPRKSWFSIEQAKGNDPVADIAIYGDIGFDGVTHADFASELRRVSADVIKLHINSPGGSVDDGIGIYNALKSHPARVEGYVDAAAHSIASVILQAADLRVMAPHSRMMIHNAMAGGAGVVFGYAKDWEAYSKEAQRVARGLQETSENIATIYAERSGKPVDYWLTEMEDERRYIDQKAVDEGLADEVGRDYDARNFIIAADFNWTRYREGNAIREELLAVSSPDLQAENDRLRAEVSRLEAAMAAQPTGEQPTNRHELRSRAVDAILAGRRH